MISHREKLAEFFLELALGGLVVLVLILFAIWQPWAFSVVLVAYGLGAIAWMIGSFMRDRTDG